MANTTIPDYLARLIDDIAVREGFKAGAYSVTSSSGSNHGDGFQGVMVAIALEGARTVDGTLQANDRLSLICKLPPSDRARREMFNSCVVFERELYAYNTVLPLLTKFQEDKGISRDLGFFQYPKCYGTHADKENEEYALVLEDLKANGYQMWNRNEKLDFEHASLALTELGKFHALSFVLRDQRPELLKQFKTLKADTLLKMAGHELSIPFWESIYKTAMETLNDNETELKEKISRLPSDYLDRMRSCLAEDSAEPFGVLNHGDFWNNNKMYKYTNGNKKPQALCLIDWQLTQFCSPAIDLAYFLFSSTESELRAQHFWDMIQVYYDSLARTVRELGSDPELLFKFEDLRAQLQRFAQYGLVTSPMLVQIMTISPDNIPDLDEAARNIESNNAASNEFMSMKDNSIYQKRMSDVIRDFFALDFEF